RGRGELLHDLVEHAPLHDGAGGRGADLARMETPDAHQRGDGRVDVGVVEHDARAFSAELQQEALHRLRAGLGDPYAYAGAAGEADHVDVGRLDQRGTGFGTRAGDDVDDAGREPDLLHDADELEAAERVLGRGLDDDGVPGRQRGGDLAGHVRDREVVGRDA